MKVFVLTHQTIHELSNELDRLSTALHKSEQPDPAMLVQLGAASLRVLQIRVEQLEALLERDGQNIH